MTGPTGSSGDPARPGQATQLTRRRNAPVYRPDRYAWFPGAEACPERGSPTHKTPFDTSYLGLFFNLPG